MAHEDYYKLLELNRDASEDDIKKSYKKLSLVYHPDRNPDKKEWAEEMFKKINEAKNVLLDPQQRRIYDQLGHEGLKSGGGRSNSSTENPFDIFGNLFGGASPFAKNPFFKGFNDFSSMFNQHQNKNVIQKQIFQEYASLENVYKGYHHNKKLKITDNCKKCEGTGKQDVVTCAQCKGRGTNIVIQKVGPNMITQTQAPCDKCQTKGKIGSGNDCSECNGEKNIQKLVEIEVNFPSGFNNKDIYVHRYENYEFIFEAIIRDHPLFKRNGNDLIYEHDITLSDALCGFEFKLNYLDDTELIIKTEDDQVIKPNTKYIVPRKGITDKGDLIINFNIQFPNKLSNQEKEQLKDILGYNKLEETNNDINKIYYLQEKTN